MAFLSFETAHLKEVLSVCSLISTPRSTVELFTYTKITLLDGKQVCFDAMNDFASCSATLTSTNLEDIKEGVSFLIKTDLLANSVALMNDALIGLDLDLKKNTIIIQSSKSKHNLRINTELAENFNISKLESASETTLSLETAVISSAIRQGAVSVGNPRTVYQPEFLNYCFTILTKEKSLVIATTDRYRVTKQKVVLKTYKTELKEDKNYLVSPRLLSILEKLPSDETIAVSFHAEGIECETKTYKLQGRYGEGNYPDYNKIIPGSFVCSFQLATGDLMEGLKQVQYFARMNAESKSVKVHVKPGDKKLVISSQTTEGYASEATLDIIKYEGPTEEWEQSFNIDYLTTFVSTVKDSHLHWEANPGKPSVLSPVNRKEELLYLVSGLK